MATAKRATRINVELLHYKQPWLDYCKQRGSSPSETFRQVVAKLVMGAENSTGRRVEDPTGRDKKVVREIRLRESEVRHAEAIASNEGFALSRWIVALVRARLSAAPQLGQRELELLARSNMQILALGRNLNQIAKAMHMVSDVRSSYRPELIEQVQTALREHSTIVATVLAANVSRWSRK